MFFKIVLICFVFLDIPTAIYSYNETPNVKKQLEIITSKIQEHIQSILQPLETLDDGRRDELKDFARVISDLYNDMAVKLQIQIEGFLEKYATMPTEIEFGTMFNDPIVGSGHKEPTSKSGNHPTNAYVEPEPLMPMVRARTTANAAEEEDLYIPNDPSVPTLSPKSSEEVDGNVIVFKTTASNDHTQSHKTPHLPLYYDGGKQQYYPRDHMAAIEAKKAKTKAQQKNTSSTKRMSSSEEERTRDINEEKKIQFKVIRSLQHEPDPLTTSQIHKLAGAFRREQKFRKRTSSEEDREKEDKDENEETKSTTPRDNKTLALTSSEEEDLNRMTGKKQPTADLPADSSEEATPSSKRRSTKKRRSKKTTKSLPTTKKVKRTTKRFRPAVKKMKKFRPTKSYQPMTTTTPTTYDPFVMYPEDSAKEEED